MRNSYLYSFCFVSRAHTCDLPENDNTTSLASFRSLTSSPSFPAPPSIPVFCFGDVSRSRGCHAALRAFACVSLSAANKHPSPHSLRETPKTTVNADEELNRSYLVVEEYLVFPSRSVVFFFSFSFPRLSFSTWL